MTTRINVSKQKNKGGPLDNQQILIDIDEKYRNTVVYDVKMSGFQKPSL